MLTATVVAVGLHIGSYHEKPGFNNVNPGIYARTSGDQIVGVYYNSLKRPTVYVVQDFHLIKLGPVRSSVALGVATGYYWPVIPMAAAGVSVGPAHISFIPKVKGVNKGAVFHLSTEWSF